MNSNLISTSELKSILNDSNLIILDASQSYNDTIQLKGARTFDIKNEFSKQDQFPNTFPSKEQFQENCQKIGINKNSKIIVYDNKGIYTSPRVWWMFKTFGHDNIAVLDGGLPEWIKQGYETEEIQKNAFPKGNFEANLVPNQVSYIEDIKQNIVSEECEVIDARSEERFNGAPESREGLRSGSIPKSINLPFSNLLKDGKFKSVKELQNIFSPIVNKEKPLIFTCGSGITACILLLGYQLAFDKTAPIYDGSWTEWGTLVSE